MDFEFDDEQLELQSVVAGVLAKECPASYVRAAFEGRHDASELWATVCGLGWPALAIPADAGGVGASMLELGIVLERLGYVADPTAFLATTTQFVPLVDACGDPEQRRRFLGAVAREGGTGTLALARHDGRWDVSNPAITATQGGSAWELRGRAAFVLDADRVDELALLASTRKGVEAFVVPIAAVRVRRTRAFDGALHVTEVDLEGVTVTEDRHLSGGDVAAGATLVLDQAVTGLALVTVGACQRAHDMAVEYATRRHQFGVPIGSFQSVKHQLVDMHVAVERARVLAYFAALAIAAGDARRPIAAAMAKAAAGDAQRILFQSIQLFGGVGYTWENDLHLYLRRAKAAEMLFGGAAMHRATIGAALLQSPRPATEILTGATDVR
jgi:alkylation response protein AidB-like acyl-CoA dehydrogenase